MDPVLGFESLWRSVATLGAARGDPDSPPAPRLLGALQGSRRNGQPNPGRFHPLLLFDHGPDRHSGEAAILLPYGLLLVLPGARTLDAMKRLRNLFYLSFVHSGPPACIIYDDYTRELVPH